MPIVSTFFGIVVRVYFDDHAPPHFHVQYAEHRAVIELDTGAVLGGSLPQRCARLVEEWRALHVAALRAAWDACQSGRLPAKIPPLD